MGSIDQGLEFLRCTKPGGRREKVGHMVAKGAVVGVLHHRHQLNGRVARGFYPWQNQLFKFSVGPHSFFFLSHPHMTFVDEGGLQGFFRGKGLVRP